ncbi:MAG: long-chain fatty acid--CoA ligase [Oligoflexia bacterium]|nr:long-chain fatty acid--CoA ligase [Oligoflexia bacterium]
MPTILHRLAQWAKDSPESSAQVYKPDSAGRWEKITAREYCNRVYYLALFLESRGITKNDAGAILSVNSPQWVHADLGTILLGAKSAGIYPNSTPQEIRYVLDHTGAAVFSVQNKEFWEKVDLPKTVRCVLAFDNDTSISPLAVGYDEAVQEGQKIARSLRKSKTKLSEFLSRLDPDKGMFLIYTSGTTGVPKGALLSLDNFTYTSDVAAEAWNLPERGGRLCSFLPLCHVAEKIQNIGVGISKRYEVTFCSRIENVAKELPEIQPTLLLSVPRLWEKMQETALHRIHHLAGPQRHLAEWALETGARVAEARYAGKLVSPVDAVQYKLADALVLSSIRRAMGLGKAQVLASGAAALSPSVSHWFHCLGLEILEDYGQTESTGVICMSEPGIDSAGTVGRPVPGLEVKVAEDGEILTRGRHVFKGYYKDPEATAQALEGGWLHTGDLAEVTAAGTLRLRGRKKEILKTSGGKMIAPAPLEEKLKASPWISHVCIVGDGRKYLTALVTLSETAHKDLSERGVMTHVEKDESVIAHVQEAVDALNKDLATYEQIKRFTILPEDFSIDAGEMTQTLKMKRNVVETRYKAVIDRMY